MRFYIPNLFDFLDLHKQIRLEEVKIIGTNTSNVKFFIRHPRKEMMHINQIVAEDFIMYNLKLNFHSNTLSFSVESNKKIANHILLQKVFQTFAIKYSAKRFGFLMYVQGRDRPRPAKIH